MTCRRCFAREASVTPTHPYPAPSPAHALAEAQLRIDELRDRIAHHEQMVSKMEASGFKEEAAIGRALLLTFRERLVLSLDTLNRLRGEVGQ
jgi:hypothetical protein